MITLSGTRIGIRMFYRAWIKACESLGISGVDLYGGTKHTTVMALRKVATFEEVRSVTQHTTNKAFERYFRTEGDQVKTILKRLEKPSKKPTEKVVKLKREKED